MATGGTSLYVSSGVMSQSVSLSVCAFLLFKNHIRPLWDHACCCTESCCAKKWGRILPEVHLCHQINKSSYVVRWCAGRYLVRHCSQKDVPLEALDLCFMSQYWFNIPQYLDKYLLVYQPCNQPDIGKGCNQSSQTDKQDSSVRYSACKKLCLVSSPKSSPLSWRILDTKY